MNEMTSQLKRDFTTTYQQDDAPVGIVALWRLLWRNKFRIAVPAFVLVVITAALVVRTTDTYTSEAQIILTRGTLEIIEFTGGDRSSITTGAVSNALTILNSRNLALQVSDRLRLTEDPSINPYLLSDQPSQASPGLVSRLMFWRSDAEETAAPTETDYDAAARQLALNWLQGSVLINVLPGSNVIIVRAVTTDPSMSARVANAYVDLYLDYQREFSQTESSRAAEALAERVGELKLQLEIEQNALQSFKADGQNVSPEALASLVSEVSDVRARLSRVNEDTEAYKAALDILETPRPEDMRAAIDENEVLIRVENEVQVTGSERAELDDILPAMRTYLADEITRNTRLRTALQSGLDRLEDRVALSNSSAIEIRQLEVELETTSQVYQSSLARLKELIVQSGLRDAGAQILARAEEPLGKDRQGRRRMVAIAGILGIFVGIAYVLLREAANDRIRRTSDLVEATGSNSITRLAPIKSGFLRRPVIRQMSGAEGFSPFFESVRSLRQQVDDLPNSSERLVIGIFSPMHREGKTTISIALAGSFVMIKKRVLLIDGDMRTNGLGRALSLAADVPGLQNVLVDGLDVVDTITTLPDLGFDVLPAGRANQNPADLLDTKAFGDLIALLNTLYDVIVIDTPPVHMVPDARSIAAKVNRHVFVADFDRSPKVAVRDAAALLYEAGARELIVALGNAPDGLNKQYGIKMRHAIKYRA